MLLINHKCVYLYQYKSDSELFYVNSKLARPTYIIYKNMITPD